MKMSGMNRNPDNRSSETNNNTEGSVPKGYRLKPETHELVELLAVKINGTKEQVISRACRMFESSVNRSVSRSERLRNKKK